MSDALVTEIRQLLVDSAPDPDQARPVMDCATDEPLDGVIPFSSLIILGFVIAVEDRFAIEVDRATLAQFANGQPTLRSLAAAIADRGGIL